MELEYQNQLIYRLENGQAALSNIDCVKWALKENKTTHSIPQNAGRGLDNVNSFIKKIKEHGN
jgi:hypothetical protein